MIENDHQEAIILEDDVVFEEQWLEKFMSVQKPDGILFIKLGSIFIDIPFNDKLYQLGNPGGTEALWITRKFAKHVLQRLNFQQSIDIFYGAILNSLGHPLVCVPVCSQTSVFTHETTVGENKSNINWIEYIKNFSKYNKYSLENLLKEFEIFKKCKITWEKKFNKRFNCSIELNNFNYLNKELNTL